MSPPGLFVTGTDTGVGKTMVACAILRGLRERGLDVGGFKPVETGVGGEGPLDALALREAAGGVDPLEEVCPERFALAAAPSAAARHEGRVIDPAGLDAAMTQVGARHDALLVEGAGGLLVPVAEGLDMAGLALRWQLRVIVVTRAALGTINHTRLTLEVARNRGLPVAGLVISHGASGLCEADAHNLEELRRDPGAPLLGEVPPLVSGDRAESWLDLDAISAVMTHPD